MKNLMLVMVVLFNSWNAFSSDNKTLWPKVLCSKIVNGGAHLQVVDRAPMIGQSCKIV